MPNTDEIDPVPNVSSVENVSQAVGGDENRSWVASSSQRTRGATLLQNFVTSNPPLGMWQATGEVGSKVPTLPEIRDGAFSDEGWSQEGQLERRGTDPVEIQKITRARRSSTSRTTNSTASKSPATTVLPHPSTVEEEGAQDGRTRSSHPMTKNDNIESSSMPVTASPDIVNLGPDQDGYYPNGYRFPKKHTYKQTITISLRAFWKFFLEPMGFCITVYGLNIIAWGAMIFFLLLGAAPAMCHPSCDDPRSARKIWIEIDSQVLNGLFCVTAFGLLPWRIRDMIFLLRWRLFKDKKYHRKLAGLNRGWYRLPKSNTLPEDVAPPYTHGKKSLPNSRRPTKYEMRLPGGFNSPPTKPYSQDAIAALEADDRIPLPATSMPDPPMTGVRALPSPTWTLDLVIWMYIANSILQGGLAAAMWSLNRFNRPSAVTGALIGGGCGTGIIVGLVTFDQGRKVKRTEGIPVQEYDVCESSEEYRLRMSKEHKQAIPNGLRVERTEKIKGKSWFTRH